MNPRTPSTRNTGHGILFALAAFLLSCAGEQPAAPPFDDLSGITVPEGFAIEPAVPPGMVSFPMFATFDHDGRLFVIESSGKTTSTEDVLENPTFRILLLEDEDGDGIFDRRNVFADKIPYPMGGTFYRGSFYAAAPPDVIRFTDTNADGVSDDREVILTGWTLNHNAATLSGPFFGPDGWMYLCDARRGFNITTKEGTRLTGKGARIWRCRPDGTGLESISGGGFDNTIELIFMPAGETIGTMTYFTDPQDGFRDALMHWVEGGVYPKPYPVIGEDRLKLTGDLMPVMTKMPRVSPSGLMRYRGSAFGTAYQGDLFSAQFNTGRVMRHKVTADGATFRTEDEPFMEWHNLEMHPTDVLEDADGSLLVVNTGGWFIAGCPLSVVAKADVPGSIIRIRRKDAPRVDDAWARKMAFGEMSATQLTTLLRDDRSPLVRDKATEEIVLRGDAAIGPLSSILTASGSEEERTRAIFALYRIGTPPALASALAGLEDTSAMVKRAAARIAGLARDGRAVAKLSELLKDRNPSVIRQAATALGQIGDSRGVAPLIAASATITDRVAEHAVIHSLITLGKTAPLVEALNNPRSRVRRSALIALDQMDNSPLTKSALAPFLEGTDSALQKTAMWVASHHPEWSDLVIGYLTRALGKEDLQEGEKKRVTELLVAFSGNSSVQEFIAAQVKRTASPIEQRLLLMNVMSRSRQIPESWVAVLGDLLRERNPRIQSQALDIIQSRKVPSLDRALDKIAADIHAPTVFRMKALGARIMAHPRLTEEQFSTVLDFAGAGNEPYVRQSAVALLVRAELSDDQLLRLATEQVRDADTYLLPGLLSAFEGCQAERVGKALITSLSREPGRLDNLSVETLRKLFGSYPATVGASASPLISTLTARQATRLSALEKLQSSLSHGDVGEGRKLFFGKALCATCHAVAGQGGTFGPDLTNIGEIRSGHDILEAIVYPGASLAREYETSGVVTPTAVYSGIIREELPEALVIETGPGTVLHLARKEITAIEARDVSLMPPGLHDQLTTDELSDLMAYLTTLPDGLGHLKSRH